MKHTLLSPTLILFLFLCVLPAAAQRTIRIIETTDVHGNYFPRDFISGTAGEGSLARVYDFVRSEREKYGEDNVFLFDAGDILQGQPSAYYYNFVDTVSQHVCAAALNFMRYDALALGNHDVEAGHAVYDRWMSECQAPVLAANVLDKQTRRPYAKPYAIVEKGGVRVAVLGLLTPTIPQWLPENLWEGMVFDDMVETARRYMPELRAKADVVIGLFHSGVGKRLENPDSDYQRLSENASLAVAQLVPGFDLILCGHDHRRADTLAVNTLGDTVRVINAGPSAQYVACADITLGADGKASRARTYIYNVCQREPDASFMEAFAPQLKAVETFTGEVIGRNRRSITTRDAYFGPSAFIDFIHSLQLRISKADISFCAPLNFDSQIPKGEVRVGDMFRLYTYENRLYALDLSGEEVLRYLNYSYDGWLAASPLESEPASMLNFLHPEPANVGRGEGWRRLAVSSYNFDSAAGLRYVVHLDRPKGQRVEILSMADGTPFDLRRHYRVAVNSYRGNGGGGHLTRGAGIAKENLAARILWSTEKDLRYYLMEEIRQAGGINARPLNLWHFSPASFVRKARKTDSAYLFR